jgi:hypothetical protein
VSPGESRTVAELLDDSDGLAREALFDMSADRAPGMVRAWPQLMQSAAELWAVLPADRRPQPMVIRSPSQRRWAGPLGAASPQDTGPAGARDEAWGQIASNFMRARRLLQEQPVASQGVSTDGPIEPVTARTQMCARCLSPYTPQRWH